VPEPAIWLAGIVLFGSGILIGWGIRAGSRGERVRRRELEEQLSAERRSFDQYRTRVSRHLDQTTHLYRDLTHQHAVFLRHLTEGANELTLGADVVRLGPHTESSEALPAPELQTERH